MTGQEARDIVAQDNDGDHHVPVHRVVRWVVWACLVALIVWQGVAITHVQDKVREANERLFRIVHGSPIATVMCDEDAKIVEYNRAAEELLGWKREEALGKDVSVMIAPSYRQQHRSTFMRATDLLRTVDEDWRVTKTGMVGNALTKEGQEVKVSFSTRGIRYGDKIEFIALMRRDLPVVPKVMESGPLELPKKIVP